MPLCVCAKIEVLSICISTQLRLRGFPFTSRMIYSNAYRVFPSDETITIGSIVSCSFRLRRLCSLLLCTTLLFYFYRAAAENNSLDTKTPFPIVICTKFASSVSSLLTRFSLLSVEFSP